MPVADPGYDLGHGDRAAGRGAEAARLTAHFRDAGAVPVDPGYLQPADLLLDLYGEDIRARAYRTDDPVHGEQMLRPDFTVPIVLNHMADAREPARYTYAGPVWRRQEYGAAQAREFWQVGYEIFDRTAPEAADAEVFALIQAGLADAPVTAITGDLSLIFAAISALKTTEARKAALRRHVWRPARFARLLQRFAGTAPFACDQADLPENPTATIAAAGQMIGLRGEDEITARIAALAEDRNTPDLSGEEVAMITALLAIKGRSAACHRGLAAIARSFPALNQPVDRMARRMEALNQRGIDADALAFDAAFGRASMEYYDGFTFAFGADHPAPVAMGGRYDALTALLGGAVVPAVGGVIRPGLLASLRGGGRGG